MQVDDEVVSYRVGVAHDLLEQRAAVLEERDESDGAVV